MPLMWEYQEYKISDAYSRTDEPVFLQNWLGMVVLIRINIDLVHECYMIELRHQRLIQVDRFELEKKHVLF